MPNAIISTAIDYFQINPKMADKISVCFEEWHAQARQLVEQEGTRFLCLYLDQKTQEVNLLSDSETLEKIGEG